MLCFSFCFECLRAVCCCPILPVSLDFPFLIAPSVFYNVLYIHFINMKNKSSATCYMYFAKRKACIKGGWKNGECLSRDSIYIVFMILNISDTFIKRYIVGYYPTHVLPVHVIRLVILSSIIINVCYLYMSKG